MGSKRENEWHDRIMMEKMAGKMPSNINATDDGWADY